MTPPFVIETPDHAVHHHPIAHSGTRAQSLGRLLALPVVLALALTARPAAALLWIGEGHGVPPGYSPKDFTIIQRGPLFHAYYILSNPALRGGSNEQMHRNETRLGHSVSTDLYAWTFVDSSFAVEPNGWDCHHVWSPSIVQADGKYWMFYTGVEDSLYNGVWLPARQRIGVAWSSDLYHWTRASGPVYDCDAPYMTWANCTAAGLRDPFVMRATSGNGSKFWMYAVTQPSSVPVGWYDPYASIVATSWADSTTLMTWSDLGPLWSTYKTFQNGPPPPTNKVESPHLFQHNGQWYLFFTGEDGIYDLTGANPVGDVPLPQGSWSFNGRFYEVGGDEFASETFDAHWAPGVDEQYFATVESVGDYRYVIRLRSVNASTAAPMLTDPVELQMIQPLAASVVNGDSISVGFVSEYPTIGLTIGQTLTRTLPLEVWKIHDINGSHTEMKMVPADYGFPTGVKLTTNFIQGDYADVIKFRAKWQPDDDDTPNRDEIQLRVRGIVSPVFAIQRTASGNVDADGPALPSRLALHLETPVERGAVTLRLALPAAVDAKLELFDLTGRRVRTLAAGTMTAGEHRVSWDRRDDRGVPVESGVYFARLWTPGAQIAVPVALRR